MKKLKLILIMTIFSLSLYSQSFELPQTIDIYSVDTYGVQDIFPSSQIQFNNDIIQTFEYDDFGVVQPIPTGELYYNDAFNSIEIYDYNQFGVRELFPTQIIEFY